MQALFYKIDSQLNYVLRKKEEEGELKINVV